MHSLRCEVRHEVCIDKLARRNMSCWGIIGGVKTALEINSLEVIGTRRANGKTLRLVEGRG